MKIGFLLVLNGPICPKIVPTWSKFSVGTISIQNKEVFAGLGRFLPVFAGFCQVFAGFCQFLPFSCTPKKAAKTYSFFSNSDSVIYFLF